MRWAGPRSSNVDTRNSHDFNKLPTPRSAWQCTLAAQVSPRLAKGVGWAPTPHSVEFSMATERAERRLAAIMFTDIVGYTALMAES